MTEQLLEETKDFTNDINTAMAMLPSNPFIIDIVSKAIQISKTNNTEDDFSELLSLLPTVIDYATKTSAEGYFKYHLVAGYLLSGVQDTLYAIMDNTGKIKEAATAIGNFLDANGWKARWCAFYDAASKNKDYTFIMMSLLNKNAEYAYAANDSYVLTGLAYIEVSLRNSSVDLTDNNIYPIYNHFMGIMQNKAIF